MPPLLIPLISTLWLDTFAVCLAIGLAPVERRARLRFAACCVMAETLMPLLGYAAASLLGPAGSLTDLLAAMVLIVAGGWSLREVLDEQGEVAEALARSRRSVATMLAAAVSVSLDELATGAVLGATHQSLMPTLPARCPAGFGR